MVFNGENFILPKIHQIYYDLVKYLPLLCDGRTNGKPNRKW